MKIPTLRCFVFLAGCWALGAAAAAAQDLRIVTAAADQDREAVLALLDEGIDVNTARPDGVTALLWAAHRDDVELAERLLAAGADVNAADDHGVTALERAAENASLAMVETLLAAGADVDAGADQRAHPPDDRGTDRQRRGGAPAHRGRGGRQRRSDRDREHVADVGGFGTASPGRAAAARRGRRPARLDAQGLHAADVRGPATATSPPRRRSSRPAATSTSRAPTVPTCCRSRS